MINDYDKNKRPDPNRRIASDPDGRPVTTTPPRRYRPGIPLLVAAFILIAALAGLMLGTPRPSTDESLMPTASAVPGTALSEPGIEPAARGDMDDAGTPATAPAGVAGTTSADSDSTMTDQSGAAPVAAFRTEDECEDANDGTPCYMQSCDRTDQIACPAGVTEAWRPSRVMNGDTGDNATGSTMDNTMDNGTANGTNTNNAIPPAENPSAPRNDGTIGTGNSTTTP